MNTRTARCAPGSKVPAPLVSGELAFSVVRLHWNGVTWCRRRVAVSRLVDEETAISDLVLLAAGEVLAGHRAQFAGRRSLTLVRSDEAYVYRFAVESVTADFFK